MYRMGSSTAVGGEWQTIVDILGGAAMVQNDTDRRLAAGTSANALPIGTYDGSDCMRMPLHAGNFNSSKYGVALWLRPADLGTQYLFSIISTDAGLTSLIFGITTGGALWVEIYVGGNFSGRHYETAVGALALNTWAFARFQWDATLTDEFDATGSNTNAKLRVFVGEVAKPITVASSFGGGTAPTALRTPNLTTGAAIWGGVSDSDSPPGAVANGHRHGPCTYVFVATPTVQQAANIMAFEAPT
jgi:hypothetical protein